MKVLIVDDFPSNLKLLRAMLESESFEVVEASDGVQALTALERHKVDAIISDILMPRMDGYRLCHEVRRSERWQALPFIFYTATYTSPSDEKLCYQVGGDKYLQKPATVQTLLSALAEASNSATRLEPKRGLLSESDMMNEYSERLVSKLEAKNVELSEAKKALEEINLGLQQAGAALQKANDDLELRVRQRTAELQSANERLEAFCYSVAHDLRSPLHHITAYSEIVLKDAATKLDERNVKCLNTIHTSAARLSALIDAMLELARVSNAPFHRQPVNLSALAEEVLGEMRHCQPDRTVRIEVAPDAGAFGDQRLLRIALMNLLGNAWKFTAKCRDARIEFGRIESDGCSHFFVRDNGAGFDMAYGHKLFTPFQRLHLRSDFEGAGIGLATVQRIIQHHGGKIWAESAPGKGAAFYFTLGEQTQA